MRYSEYCYTFMTAFGHSRKLKKKKKIKIVILRLRKLKEIVWMRCLIISITYAKKRQKLYLKKVKDYWSECFWGLYHFDGRAGDASKCFKTESHNFKEHDIMNHVNLTHNHYIQSTILIRHFARSIRASIFDLPRSARTEKRLQDSLYNHHRNRDIFLMCI